MMKRACPFGESSPIQMKTHVGQKEVAQGVDKEKRMKEVYEKTLAMMFASQKQSSDHKMNVTAGAPTNAMPTSDMSTCVTNGHHPENSGCSSSYQMELLPGQCLLDEHGRIIAGKTVPPKSKEAKQAVPPRCCACCKPMEAVMACCYSCDSPLCPSCARQCLQCENRFCNICSMINYDENCDRIFCISCSSRLN